jgi:hypothetical protein
VLLNVMLLFVWTTGANAGVVRSAGAGAAARWNNKLTRALMSTQAADSDTFMQVIALILIISCS